MERDEAGFLKELTEVSKKYGLVIGGCGCCGSPFIVDIKKNKDYLDAPLEVCEYQVIGDSDGSIIFRKREEN